MRTYPVPLETMSRAQLRYAIAEVNPHFSTGRMRREEMVSLLRYEIKRHGHTEWTAEWNIRAGVLDTPPAAE
jgi:hypothetical protein